MKAKYEDFLCPFRKETKIRNVETGVTRVGETTIREFSEEYFMHCVGDKCPFYEKGKCIRVEYYRRMEE